MKQTLLDEKEISSLLPYGESFLFVHQVLEMPSSRSIITSTTYSISNPIIQSHFKSGPYIVPGALMTEQVAQSAQLLGKLLSKKNENTPFLIGQVKASFLQPAECPCTLTAIVNITLVQANGLGFMGKVLLNKRCVAKIKGVASRAQKGP